jgi:hypothetical protein
MATRKPIEPGTGAIARARANRVDSAVDAMAAGRAPPNQRAAPEPEPTEYEKTIYRFFPSMNPRNRKK